MKCAEKGDRLGRRRVARAVVVPHRGALYEGHTERVREAGAISAGGGAGRAPAAPARRTRARPAHYQGEHALVKQ